MGLASPANGDSAWKRRCVVVCPRHAFIRSWIRAYFSCGNDIPVVIVTGPDGDWNDDDMEYCHAAARFSGGMVFDASKEWESSKHLASRAVRRENIGWFSKKSILYAIATRLSPESWAWIDDDVEIDGNIEECFEYSENAPGFICSEFYYPGEIDNRHPSMMYRSNIDTGDKICWNSMIFFHGDANERISEELCKEYPVEDDEIIFADLYKKNQKWHDGFCDFSYRQWQAIVKVVSQIPESHDYKAIHYTASHRGAEVKKMWADKASRLPPAPFEERAAQDVGARGGDNVVDAVFVIGNGSQNGNEELRYALRNIENNCKFVRDVYICGECPAWVDKSVVKHLRWPDRFSHAKDANIIDKLRHACEHPGIASKILFCSDDQFNTKPCSWEDFRPRYLRQFDSSDRWYDGKRRIWHTRLKKTLEREVERRVKLGIDTKSVFYFQPHMWMQIDRDGFLEYARWCGYENRNDTIIASGYFNFICEKGEPDFDHVFLTGGDRTVPDATHVAYHDGSYNAAMRILKILFPNKCRFEMSTEGSGREEDVRDPITLSVRDDESPSPATSSEMSELKVAMAKIRDNPIWANLMGEVSRAEELRLFGVRGWRIVWRDILSRWAFATRFGEDSAHVQSNRSDKASAVMNMYMSDPDSLRTRRFGVSQPASSTQKSRGGRTPMPADVRSALHERVRSLATRK